MNLAKYLQWSFLLSIFILSGCGSMQVVVRQTIDAPAEVDMPGVRSLAVIDFAVPWGEAEPGQRFARHLYDLFREQTDYQLIPSEQAGRFLQANRISPSRFRELPTVYRVGQGIGADAILFGDLPNARVQQQNVKRTETRQVGWEKQKVKVTDPDGKVRTVTRSVPVYQDFLIETIYRTVEIQAEARLVSVKENRVLWENDQSYSKQFETVKVNGVWHSGDKQSDAQLVNRALHQFSRKFIKEILPRRVLRNRQLAFPADEGDYRDLVAKGNQAAGRNDWKTAGSFWLKAMALEPERAETRANLGVLREGERQFTQALSDYQYAAKKLGKPWSGYYRDLQKILEKDEK